MDMCLHRTLLTLAMMVTSVPADPPTEPRPRLCHAAGDPRRRLGRFSGESSANYSCLLLSSDGQRLYVGGRDQILSLHTLTFSSTTAVDQIRWRATDAKIQECWSKGKSKQRDCFNFIVAVLPVNESCLYACGTYAYSPTCTYIDTRTFSLRTAVDKQPLTEDCKGRVPFDPALRFTAAMVEGALYSGTSGNFLGTQHVISRSLGHQVPLKTEASLSWLQGRNVMLCSGTNVDRALSTSGQGTPLRQRKAVSSCFLCTVDILGLSEEFAKSVNERY
ncbi:semaphorin-4B-like [Amblyraja radiata]|uniref:semaphorin-4B-like n=1 Tax=Amblyraja radiata TaxID=386614 RepID=UPI0014040BE8|nr:semaphorin-4B-like [Amblyraja radiata]